MQLELVGELRDQRHHAGVVRARAQFREDRLVAADEELDPEDAVAAERADHFPRLVAGRHQCGLAQRRGLPALAIVPELLAVPDRRAEQDSVLGRDREQGDLAVEGDEFLDNDPRPVAAHFFDRIVPRLADVGGGLGRALAFARGRHDRLDHARETHSLRRGDRFVAALREPVLGGDQAELVRGEVADAVAVHGQLHRFGGGRDAPPFLFELGQRRRVDRLDLGDDDVGLVLLDRGAERFSVEHRKDLERVGELHCRRVGIAVARDHPAAQALGRDRELAAQFARAQQHQGGGEHGAAIAAPIMLG